jgi:arylsulfatase
MSLGRSLLTLGCALISAAMFAALPALAQEKKPNVVFILVDNVGWGTFGAYGGTIPTPRIDKMASEGIRFNNYNVEAQCTPSRSASPTTIASTLSATSARPCRSTILTRHRSPSMEDRHDEDHVSEK